MPANVEMWSAILRLDDDTEIIGHWE